MNLLQNNDIIDILAFGIIPYEIITHSQKVSLLFNFDFDIKQIFKLNKEEIKKLLNKKELISFDFSEFYSKAEELINNKVNFITCQSQDFPFECWKNIAESTKIKNNSNTKYYKVIYEQCKLLPFLLFYEGNIEILKTEKISIVGTRKPLDLSIDFTMHIVWEVKKTVVSGFAIGIDHFAHFFAFQQNIPTIAVFGCGTNIIYPKSNLELYSKLTGNNFLIISEFAPDTLPKKYYFPIRNRIIAAFGDDLICIQAGEKSGALITVNYAKQLGKPVYVFYPIELKGFEGNKNLFINNQSKLIYGIKNNKFYTKTNAQLSIDGNGNKNEVEIDLLNLVEDAEILSKEQIILLKEIFIHPYKSLEYYCQTLNFSIQTIISSIESLQEKGFIKRNKINQIFPDYSKNIIKTIFN